MKAHARQVTRRRGQRTCLFSGHSERLVHARVVAVFHRIVACGVVVGRAGRQGRRADGLLDDWLLLERVERRRVWQDPLERAPCVAPGPARQIRSPEPPRRRRPAAQSGGAGGSGTEGQRSVTSGFPYPGVSRSGLRRGRTRALLARPRFSTGEIRLEMATTPTRARPRQARPAPPPSRPHNTTCASDALPSPRRRVVMRPPPPSPVRSCPALIFLRVQFQLDHHHASGGCGAGRYPCCRSAPS
eukprot:COSAG04_NODE_1916_length_5227_cov_2.096139_1_plen_243_part_10